MKKGYWTKEKCQDAALNCNFKKEFSKKYPSAYGASYTNNWINEICLHMKPIDNPSGYWTKEKCEEKSLECINRDQFKKKYKSAYNSAYKNKWLDEICSHMLYENHVENNYWTKEKCKEVALKCKLRSEFCKNYRSPYDSSVKNGWLDEICSHMEVCGNLHNRLVYLFEFSDNSVYIGLTYNSDKRHKDHLTTDIDSSVYKHVKKTGLTPNYKKLSDYIEIKKAMELEIYYIEYYKELGYTILNKTKGGECGGCYSRYDYNACKLLTEKYTLKELRKLNRYAYVKIKKEGWLNEFYN